MKQKSPLAKALRTMASFVESLSEEEIDLLVAGKGKLSFTPFEKVSSSAAPPFVDSAAYVARIRECSDREKARTILSELPNRDAVAAFAKSQNLHVAKHHSREDVENKIIEFIVGARLRSEAIRTLNMKGGSNQTGS